MRLPRDWSSGISISRRLHLWIAGGSGDTSSIFIYTTHTHTPTQTPTLYLEWAPIAMATLAYWLMGRLYPTADDGLFFICEDLLSEDRGGGGVNTNRNQCSNIKPVSTKEKLL